MLHGIILDQNCRSVLLNCEAEPFQSRRCAFGAAGLRRCDLTEPALERRRMAFPEAQESASRPDKLPQRCYLGWLFRPTSFQPPPGLCRD
jgi:hypothetical protein